MRDIVLTFAAFVTLSCGSVVRSQTPDRKPANPTAPTSWPMFGGNPSRNMVNDRDRGLPTDWSTEDGKTKNIHWTADIGGKSFGSPIIAGGKVLVATHTRTHRIRGVADNVSLILAYRETDGKLLWHNAHPFPEKRLGSWWSFMGAPSNPAVDGEGIYYVTPACVLVRADLDTGKIRWQYDMARELKVHSGLGTFWSTPPQASPLIIGNRVFVTTNNGCVDDIAKWPAPVANPEAPSFIALDKNTGKLLWQSNRPGKRILDGSWASPVFTDIGGIPQVIFAGGDGVVYSFVPESGELIWKCDCILNRNHDEGTDNSIVATPAIAGDKLFVCLGRTGEFSGRPEACYLLCLDLRKKGDVSLKSYDARDAANRTSALVWSYGGPIVPRPAKGRSRIFHNSLATPAIQDGLLYISEENGYLHCLDAATGRRVWMHDFRTGTWGSPYWADDRIFVGSDAGITIFAHGRELKVLNTIETEGGCNYITPSSANGSLYIASGTTLFCVKNSNDQ